ncbi:MAG: HAD family hydrolase [Faecalibacterium sp.]|nr:HAD family hydrolase [Faecalibacterium sp.]
MLACDFDNTLVPFGEAGPRPEVAAEIRRIQKAGTAFVVCTGRCKAALETNPALLRGLRYDYAVCSNGGQVVDKAGKTLFSAPMTNEEMYALVDFCEDYEHPLEFAFSDGYYAYEGYEELAKFYRTRQQTGLVVYDGEDQDRHLTEMPTAAFLDFPAGELERFQAKYGYLNIEFLLIGEEKGHYYYDVMHAGTDKGVGLRGLCEAIGIPLNQVVAVGDGNNDIGMLKAAGLGCAMGNAAPAVKAAAGRVIGDVKENGLAALTAELWPAADSENRP